MFALSMLRSRATCASSFVGKSLTPNTAILGNASASLLPSVQQPPSPQLQLQHQQVRWVTKKRQHRQAKHKRKAELAEKGIFPPKPNNYIPKDTPVLNAISRDERDANSKRQDAAAAQELKGKMELAKGQPLLRYGFDPDLVTISERVQRLLDLHNGNQQEVVKAQKQRGMELFQMREGDTGSSAVQGTFLYCILHYYYYYYHKYIHLGILTII